MIQRAPEERENLVRFQVSAPFMPKPSGYEPVERLMDTCWFESCGAGQFLAAAESGWFPPKELCGSSTLPREAIYAAQAQIAGQVLGKNEMQSASLWCGSNHALQALLAMRPACTREIVGSIPALGSNSLCKLSWRSAAFVTPRWIVRLDHRAPISGS